MPRTGGALNIVEHIRSLTRRLEKVERVRRSAGGGGGGGAPVDATYLTGTSNPTLTNEIVVGTTPGGELGNTWASPTVDATHSGSAHHGQSHALSSGTDHTGSITDAQHGARTVASAHGHSDLTGIGADDHHARDHHARHEPAGADPMAVDAAAATGSLRTLGAGATQAAAGNHGHVASTSVAFTDGDTLRRVTVSDAAVAASSKIIATVRRPDTANDSADSGYLYLPNVVRVATGAFDVLIACLDWGFDDPTLNPPNETVTLCYQVAA